MARIRTIKPEFWDSPDTAKASPRARLLYIAMWNWADDYGVGTAGMKELVGFAFPNDDDMTAAELPSLCKEVADNFGTLFYTVRGRPFYAIPSWDEHQRTERKSKRRNPEPDHPDARPDLRIHENRGTTVDTQGTTVGTQGSSGVGKGTGEREQGNRGKGSSDLASSVGAGATLAVHDAPTAQTLVAEWVDHCDQPPPARVKGHVAKEVGTMLAEGIDYERVRRGLQTWQQRGLNPSTLPSIVHELAVNPNGTSRRQSETDAMFERAAKRAIEREGSER